MQALRLLALDEQDLGIVSAHVQDGVLKVGDIEWLPGEKRLILPMNRFVWEKKRGWFAIEHERRRAVLSFDRVLSVTSAAIDRTQADDVLSLLAIRFLPSDAPAGTIELDFAAGATMRLGVECIEARLADIGGAWRAGSMPRHD